MDYRNIGYEISTKKDIPEETRIVAVSDFDWDTSISGMDMNNLAVCINDFVPKYICLLGNICTINNLYDEEFRKKYLYFLKLLSCITKTFVVFGNKDYRYNNETYNINKLLEIYNKEDITILNNSISSLNNINIAGFNKEIATYNNIDKAKNELLKFISDTDQVIDKNKLSVLISNYELNHLKLEKQLLNTFDLVITATKHKTNNNNENIPGTNIREIIRTGGINKNEICIVKVNKLKETSN